MRIPASIDLFPFESPRHGVGTAAKLGAFAPETQLSSLAPAADLSAGRDPGALSSSLGLDLS